MELKSDLKDINGKTIEICDYLLFKHYNGCQWIGKVIFQDGVLTVSVDSDDIMQMKNPVGWDQEHDWIQSRHWGSIVGFGEFGTWNCPRQPLTLIVDTWRDYENELRPLQDKFGLDGRIIKAEVVSRGGESW